VQMADTRLSITWTPIKVLELKMALATAKAAGKDKFKFLDTDTGIRHVFLAKYAEYLAEYLSSQFGDE
jgi:hypothetical protein